MRDACAGLRATNADADTDAETRQKKPLSGQPTNHSSWDFVIVMFQPNELACFASFYAAIGWQ